MKTSLSNNRILAQLDKTSIDELVNQVAETIAMDQAQPAQKANFIAAELWKIQRTVRTASSRRRF